MPCEGGGTMLKTGVATYDSSSASSSLSSLPSGLLDEKSFCSSADCIETSWRRVVCGWL